MVAPGFRVIALWAPNEAGEKQSEEGRKHKCAATLLRDPPAQPRASMALISKRFLRGCESAEHSLVCVAALCIGAAENETERRDEERRVKSKRVVAVLFGGRSSEREVSLVSGSAVAQAIDRMKYDVVTVHIMQNGCWELTDRLYSQDYLIDSYRDAERGAKHDVHGRPNLSQLWPILRDVDIVFPVLHGPYGEDGTVQGLLETAGIPYVGGSVLFHSLCMHKPMLKRVLEHHSIPTPAFRSLAQWQWKQSPQQREDDVVEALGLPLFVKPASLGSSIGITKVTRSEALGAALRVAYQYDALAIIEEAIKGREIECAVMGNHRPIAAPVLGEILPCNEFYDYEAKYVAESTLLVPPPSLDPAVKEQIRDLAVRAFEAADGSGYARVDFLVGERGPLVNEINTIPGFTEISMFPRLFTYESMSFPELVDRLIDLAGERFSNRPAP
jgi:D-alanine-D-alanine ligase